MFQKPIFAVYRFVKPYALTLRRKRNCILRALRLCPCSLLMRLQNTVNTMKTAMRSTPNMERFLSRNIQTFWMNTWHCFTRRMNSISAPLMSTAHTPVISASTRKVARSTVLWNVAVMKVTIFLLTIWFWRTKNGCSPLKTRYASFSRTPLFVRAGIIRTCSRFAPWSTVAALQPRSVRKLVVVFVFAWIRTANGKTTARLAARCRKSICWQLLHQMVIETL